MQFDAINARISSIRDDAEETGRFVEEYKPFIASCTEKVTGRFVNYGSDDELSIAMIAFVEAIRSFDSSKGNFFSFSRNVIKRRLIENQDLMHKKLDQGVMLLLTRAVEQGYLSGDADDPQGVQDMPGGSAGPQTGAYRLRMKNSRQRETPIPRVAGVKQKTTGKTQKGQRIHLS